ncbi:GlcG/HbpS family heme-binding protein [Jannaschia sp. LMIT008]|uniref:GlcG/HbpS family heme-binding protein n=1 Tax=Jannaschia maritima TaxID=3032585 RepID=UPI002810A088|nr:heme-binding protein [Jannaschia sp. LMIT008]
MTDYVAPTLRLTHRGAMAMLEAAVEAADAMGVPQCVVVVDASAVVVGQVRMDGAKVLSMDSALAKARTAASIGAPSAEVPEAVRPAIAAATSGAVTGLAGGLPIRVDGVLLGGIGVGSGAPDEDVAVARAALAALG